MGAGEPLRVLVADDSPTARALLGGVLSADPAIRVVGEAADGVEAVALTRELRPSLVLMDIEMPNMDGFEATKRIMIDTPTPIIIVSARYEADHVEFGLRALRAGALTIVPKPAGPADPRFAAQAQRLVTLTKALSQVKVVRQHATRGRIATGAPVDLTPPAPPSEPAPDPASRPLAIIGVGATTGGPTALYRFLEELPRTLDVPVLVVQHIADGFVGGLAKWLAGATVLPVSVPDDGQVPASGEVYLAPDKRHLTIVDGAIRLSAQNPTQTYCPSVNELFASLAQEYGPAAAGVVLTGMGNDGVEGARALHGAGGRVLAQDANTSVVYGMPRAVLEAGVVDVVGPVETLARRLVRLAPVKGGAP